MQNLIGSLRSLPPKQALLLALTEKQRRMKIRAAREQALQQQIQSRADLYAGASSRTEDAPPDVDPSIPSLVLDRNHPLSDLYYKQAPYKVYWGGRGSAKSWGFAEALVRKASVEPLRILCTREHQNSIKDSSYRLLVDTIKRLGMEGWFSWTANSITCRSGAEFIFKGLWNNEEGIKSTEGIDICWVEEAQTVTARSWQTLTPTIRKETAEIWVSYNLINEEDATHQRFVVHGRTGAIVHKVNYDSNPFFGGRLRAEMEDDKRLDTHLYEHIWLGLPLKISNAIIMSGKYVIQDFADDLWKHAARRRLGLDWGFAQDPLALISFFELNNKLYIERECYDVGIELDQMAERFDDEVPEARDWPIKADCAQPAQISHLRTRGFAISGAEKWEGCVKDGIKHLRQYDQIVIHTRCANVGKEARLYKYKTDPKQVDEKGQPQVLPIIVDKNNHAWDAIRYGLDGEIQRSGSLGQWERLGEGFVQQPGLPGQLGVQQ